MSEPVRLVATPSQTVGPFFHFGLTDRSSIGTLATPDVEGERIALGIRVLDGDGQPVPDALVEIWHADPTGRYVRPPNAASLQTPPAFTGFGRLPTLADGTCRFTTIRPGPVRDDNGLVQASHINVCLFARGLLRQLYTRIYFEGDAALDSDPILQQVPADRRRTLLASRSVDAQDGWSIDIRLQGDGETVFFDL
jgi:protocatechuate 3,4-dioxygenase alpha subunit